MRAGALGLAAVGLAACVSTGAQATSGASGQLVQPGRLVSISDPGMALATPSDGRINGPGFNARVTGAGESTSISSAGQSLRAPAGDVLLVFSLDWTPAAEQLFTNPAETASVSAGGLGAEVPPADLGSAGTLTYALAVPRHSQAVLSVSSQGVTQGFSLTKGTRLQPQLSAYYRDPSTGTLTQAVSQTASVTANSPDGSHPTPVNFGLDHVTLAYLSPAGTPAPAGDQAWLVADISADTEPVGANFFFSFNALPPSAVVLHLPDGTAVPAQVEGTNVDGNAGLLNGTYYFPVPAGLTGGQLVITPSGVNGSTEVSGYYEPAIFSGPATFNFTLPPVPAPSGAGPGFPLRVAAAAVPATSGRSGNALPWLVAVIVVLLAAGLAGAATGRRRRRRATVARPAHTGPVVEAQAIPMPPAALTEVSADGPPSDTDDGAPVQGTEDEPAPPVTTVQPVTPSPARAPVEISILGPRSTTGWASPPRRPVVEEILDYLALHPERPFTADELKMRLRPTGWGETEVKRDTITSYVSKLRGWLPPGCLPDGSEVGGYRLSGVGTDWHRFVDHVTAADAATDTSGEVTELTRALALVRGEPFDGVQANGTYPWLNTESWLSRMTTAITGAADRLVRLHLGAGRHREAMAAADAGLRAAPDAKVLHIVRLNAAAALGHDVLDRAWADTKVAMEDSAELEAHYRRLRRGDAA